MQPAQKQIGAHRYQRWAPSWLTIHAIRVAAHGRLANGEATAGPPARRPWRSEKLSP